MSRTVIMRRPSWSFGTIKSFYKGRTLWALWGMGTVESARIRGFWWLTEREYRNTQRSNWGSKNRSVYPVKLHHFATLSKHMDSIKSSGL